MKARFTYFFLFLISASLNAQSFTIAWQKCLGGSASEKKPIALARTDQSYTVSFSTSSNNGDIADNHGEFDWFVKKFDKNDVSVINKIYGSSKTEDFSNITENADKTYLSSGTTNSPDGTGNVVGLKGGTDGWFAKYTSNGLLSWRKCIGGTSNDEGASAEEVENGNYLLLGSAQSADGDFTTNAGGKDIFLVKTDLNGIIAWTKTYGGSLDDKAVAMLKLADGYVIAAESSSSNGPATNSNHGGKDILLMKVDQSGTVVWAKFFGGSADDSPAHLLLAADGNILLTGTTASNSGDVNGNHGGTDIWVAKITTLGSIVWAKCFGGTADDSGAMASEFVTPNKYYLIGTTASNNGNVSGAKGGKDIYVARISTSGNYETSKNFGGSSDDIGTSIDITFDKSLLIAGETFSSNGDVTGNHGGGDAWVAKVSTPVATFEAINDFEITIAPNPAKTNLSLDIPDNINVDNITIQSITGITSKLINKNESDLIDLSDLSAGHYFVTIYAKQGIARKMIEVVR